MTYKKKVALTAGIVLPFIFASLLWGILTGLEYYRSTDPTVAPSDIESVRIANLEKDYQHFQINPDGMELFEDGFRSLENSIGFEQWRFEVKTDMGETVTVLFSFNDPLLNDKKKKGSLTISRRQGSKIQSESVWFETADCRFNPNQCDIQMGENSCQGDLNQYRVKAKTRSFSVEFKLTGKIAPFRFGSGYILFGEDYNRYIGMVMPVPAGIAEGKTIINQKEIELIGVGTHDHLWSPTPLNALVTSVWSSRFYSKEKALFATTLTPRNRYGATPFPLFALLESDNILADSSRQKSNTSFACLSQATHPDKNYKKEIVAEIQYEYKEENNKIKLQIENRKLLESLSLAKKRGDSWLKQQRLRGAKIFPWQTRFNATLTLTTDRNGEKTVLQQPTVQQKLEFN